MVHLVPKGADSTVPGPTGPTGPTGPQGPKGDVGAGPAIAARAQLSSAFAVTGTSWNKVPFDTKVFDSANNFDLVNHRFVAPNAGYYQVNTSIAFGPAATAPESAQIGIFKNGAQQIFASDYLTSAGQYWYIPVSDILQLAVGDYVEIFAASNAGQPLQGGYSFMSVAQVAQPGPAGPQGIPGGNATVPMDTVHYVGNAGEPPFQNGWSNFASDPRKLRFRKDPLGKVRISGLVASGTVGQPVFTLPVGYRPPVAINQPSVIWPGDGANSAQVAIGSDGIVAITGANASNYTYLDNIEFDTESVTQMPTGPQGPAGPQGVAGGGTPIVYTATRASGSAVVMTAGAWTKIPIDSVTNDTNGMADTANGRCVIKTAGWYTIAANAYLSNVAANAGVSVSIYRNGAAIAQSQVSNGNVAGSPINPEAVITVSLGVGDIIEMYAICSAGAQYQYSGNVNFLTVTAVASQGPQGPVGPAGTPGLNAPPSLVTSLPASPTDGQEIYYLVDSTNGVIWHLRYRAASSSTHKWEYLGGPPLVGATGVGVSYTTGSPGYTWGPAMAAPQLTVPLPGDYQIEMWLDGQSSTAIADWRCSTYYNGSGMLAGYGGATGGSSYNVNVSFLSVLKDAVINAVLDIRLATSGAGSVLQVGDRAIKLQPVRIG